MEYGRSIDELTRDELIELKQHYYDEKHPEGVSYGELAAIDELVSDEEIKEAYGGIVFVAEDFFTDFVNADLDPYKLLGLQRIGGADNENN